MADAGPQLSLVIVVDAPQQEELETLLTALGIVGQVASSAALAEASRRVANEPVLRSSLGGGRRERMQQR